MRLCKYLRFQPGGVCVFHDDMFNARQGRHIMHLRIKELHMHKCFVVLDNALQGTPVEIVLTPQVSVFGRRSFMGSNIREVHAPECVHVGRFAFRDCRKLRSIFMPHAEFSYGAFNNCDLATCVTKKLNRSMRRKQLDLFMKNCRNIIIVLSMKNKQVAQIFSDFMRNEALKLARNVHHREDVRDYLLRGYTFVHTEHRGVHNRRACQCEPHTVPQRKSKRIRLTTYEPCSYGIDRKCNAPTRGARESSSTKNA